MLYDRLLQIENGVAESFVLENTDNAVGAYILYRYAHIRDPYRLDSIYHLFDKRLRAGAYLTDVEQKIQALSLLKRGGIAPDFLAISHLNQPVSIAAFRGKLVVIDFWGSWCNPCIKGLPKMKAYYVKYKQRVAFIGIDCADTDSAWRHAIEQYRLDWPQIRNGEGAGDIAKKYNVEAYPTKIIIDETGHFLYSFAGEDDAFYKRLEQFLQ